jgi:hypothetical protein
MRIQILDDKDELKLEFRLFNDELEELIGIDTKNPSQIKYLSGLGEDRPEKCSKASHASPKF